MTNAAPTSSPEVLPLPRLSDDTVAEIHNFLEYLFDLFEARYADQITRFYASMSRNNLLEDDPDWSPSDPPF